MNSDGAVVVPADHGGSSLACIRSLGRRGIPVIAHSRSPTAAAARSRYCTEHHVTTEPGVAAYRDALLELARRPDVTTIVPLYETDIYVLSQNRDAFAEHIETPWKSFQGIRAAQDRVQLFETADAIGVPTPDTALLDEWDDWSEQTVIKPRYGVTVDDDESRYGEVQFPQPGSPPDVDGVVDAMGHVPIVQEYVPGNAEFGYFALYDRGEAVASFQHRRIRSYTYSGGASVYRKAVDVPDLETHGRALLDQLDWHGPAMVEFKRDERDGSFRLMEVNPRFWGSLPLAVVAGVDFPALYYDLATGGVETPVHEYEVGVGCHTLLGEVSYLHSVARYDLDHAERPSLLPEIGRVAASILREPNFDYASLDDPRPILRQVANLL